MPRLTTFVAESHVIQWLRVRQIETADGSRSGRKYKQTFSNNMQTKGTPKVTPASARGFSTSVFFAIENSFPSLS